MPTDYKRVEQLKQQLSKQLDVFDQMLGAQKFMGGNSFSLIDIFYMPYTAYLFKVGDESLITERENVNSWWERVTRRDSWKAVGL